MRKAKKSDKKIITHDQWIDIEQIDGKTVSTFYAPNDEFERLRREMDPQPDLIYRRLNVMGPVPKEYLWTKPTPQAAEYGGHCLVRMKIEDWLEVMDMEIRRGSQHALPPRVWQPRPEEFGPCPCERCTAKREAEYEALRQASAITTRSGKPPQFR